MIFTIFSIDFTEALPHYDSRVKLFSLYWTHLITIRRGEKNEEKNLYASGRNDAGR